MDTIDQMNIWSFYIFRLIRRSDSDIGMRYEFQNNESVKN